MVSHEHHEMRRSMQIRVLGHLEASVDDRPVALGGAKQRAVLAMLGLEANRTVTADRLIEGLWGEHAPASAAKMVQNYVWRLRGCWPPTAARRSSRTGAAMSCASIPSCVDVRRFERLSREAGRAAEAGEPATRRARRSRCGAAPRSPTWPTSRSPRRRSAGSRSCGSTAAELAIDADLAAGRHQEVVGEIEALLAEHPLRERLHAQRMLALYRCGRQAEALEAYRRRRRTLVEEIGVEPGPELRRLHEAILRQDPSLDVEPAAAELPRELDAAAVAAAGRPRRRAAPAARALAAGRDGRRRAGDARRRVRDGQDAAGGGDRGRRAPRGCGGALRGRDGTARGGARRHRARARFAASDAAGARRRRPRAGRGARRAARARAARSTPCRLLVLATGQEAAALARLEPRDSLALEPLDADAVRLIAGLYAPAGDADAVPVDDAARRQPRRARGACTRRRASGRVARRRAASTRWRVARRPAAARPARSRPSWPAASSTCSRRASAPGCSRARRRAEATVVCPYKGLATFDVDDAEYFFGRERLVAELVARLVGAPLLGVVGPSGSGKSSVLRAGLLPALAGGVLPGSDALGARADPSRRAPDARASRAPSTGSATGIGARARGRPVRGAVHRLPGRAGARRVRRRARACRCATRTAAARRARAARRLLRPLRRLPRAVAPARRQPRARRTDVARRAAARDRAAGAARRAAASSPSSSTRCWPTSRASRAPCRCCRPRCSSSGGSATGGACGSPRTSAAAASRAPSRGWPRTRSSGSIPPSRRWRATCCCASRARARAARSCAAGSRSPSWSERRRRRRRRRRAAHRPPPADGQRGRGRGRARGAAARMAAAARLAATRTRRAGACTASSATPPASGTPTARDPGEPLPRRAAGGRARVALRATSSELNATERAFLDASRAARRARAAAGCGSSWPACRCCSSSPSIAGARRARPARQRARRGSAPPRRSGSARRR